MKNGKILAVLVALTLPHIVFADSSVDFKVKGTIKTKSCTPTLSNSSVDVGKISVASLDQDNANQLTPVTTDLTIRCPTPMLAGIEVSDDKSESSDPNLTVDDAGFEHESSLGARLFGLGKTADGNSVGDYTLAIGPTATVDGGKTLQTVRRDSPEEGNWSHTDDGLFGINPEETFAVVDKDDDTTPVAFTSVTFNLKIAGVLEPASKLPPDTPIDGQATFSVVYL